MKQRVEEMEREANKLRELQAAAEKKEQEEAGADGTVPMETDEEKAAADSRSVYVGNVRVALVVCCVCVCVWALTRRGVSSSCRSTTARLRKRSSNISSRVGRLTGLQFFVTSLQAILKGEWSFKGKEISLTKHYL